MQTPNVRIECVGAVLCVTFDRPDKKNALNRAMYTAATGALHLAGGDSSVGAVVFSGSGGVFTAGNDIADLLIRVPENYPPLHSSRLLLLARHRSLLRSKALP